MATAAVTPYITVEEYLHTYYKPDVDYVDRHTELAGTPITITAV